MKQAHRVRVKETTEEQVGLLQQHIEPLDKNAKTENGIYELLFKSGVPLIAGDRRKK